MHFYKKRVLKDGQRWFLSSDTARPVDVEAMGACMLASEKELAFSSGDRIARWAIESHCQAIAIVAPNAEAIHDSIDRIVEDKEAYDLVTTFHTGPDALGDAIAMLRGNGSLSGSRPVFVYADSLLFIETGLRAMGLLD